MEPDRFELGQIKLKRSYRDTPPEVNEAIIEEWDRRPQPTKRRVHEIVVDRFRDPDDPDFEIVSYDTVCNHINARDQKLFALGSVAPKDQWRLGMTDNDAAVLRVLAEIMALSGGRVRSLKASLAVLIARIYSLQPNISVIDAIYLAAEYETRREEKKPTADLDAYLALAPWRDDLEGARQYTQLVRAGIPRVQLMNAFMAIHEVEKRESEAAAIEE